jgi:hypothetical protein
MARAEKGEADLTDVEDRRAAATRLYTPRPPSRWDEAVGLANRAPAVSLLQKYGVDGAKSNYGRFAVATQNATHANSPTDIGGGASMAGCPAGTATFAASSELAAGHDEHARTNIKIQMYTVWHAKKPAAAKPAKGANTSVEYGSGAAQWLWFKKTNIPIRDAAKNMKSSLGSLAANAISAEMQIALASSMVNEKEVHPRPGMRDTELDEWIEADPTFTWFHKLKNETLISVLDSIYGVRTPEPFLRFKLEAVKPVRSGELYYPVDEFTEHADKWLCMLTQLKDGGWDSSHTDLREVFLKSVESCSLVHEHARQSQLKNVHRLIALT